MSDSLFEPLKLSPRQGPNFGDTPSADVVASVQGLAACSTAAFTHFPAVLNADPIASPAS